jgi:hypothetical protein
MSGHVNMMDDVLILNLPPEILRSSLRSLIAQGNQNRSLFITDVRENLRNSHSWFPQASILFPEPDCASTKCLEYLRIVRCIFSSKPAESEVILAQ